MIDNIFNFSEETFGEGQEIIILVTEMTANFYSSHFLARYGNEKYFRHNKDMLFYERQKEIALEILELNFDEE